MNLLYCSMKIYELLKEIGTDISFDLISDILKDYELQKKFVM